ncbi:MAG: hypothetical protein IT373_12270 [Polyangiaceae bacterium]|nr:hypothetical protein [Polyangiaceae bacterium]
MNHGKRTVLGGLAAVGVLGISMAAVGANTVKETVDNCMNAHAVLLVSRSGNHALLWQLIGNVVKSNSYEFRVQSDYEPMVSQKVSFRQYDVELTNGATAYVAHCGHGGTCNKLAQAILKNYPDAGSPWVFCGQVPYLLQNPSSAPSF